MRKTLSAFLILAATLLLFGQAHAKPGYGTCSNCHPGNGIQIPPTASAGADQTVTGGASVTLNGANSTDQDDGIASYQWVQTVGTKVALSGASTAKAGFTAPAVTVSTSYTFQLTVTDKGGAKDTDTCIVTMNPASTPPTNKPPVASAGADRTVKAGAAVVLNGANSTDPDDGIASYQWVQTAGPKVSLTGATKAKATFTAPPVTADTSYTFQLTVKDKGGLTSKDSCIINVTAAGTPPANEPPVANAGPNKTVMEGKKVRLDGSASADPDDGIASYRWVQLDGPTVTLSSPNAVSTIFAAPVVGPKGAALTFRLIVKDHAGLRAADTCIVNVTDAPTAEPPVAGAGANKTVEARDRVILDGTDSIDPDGAIDSYRWRQISGPTVTLSKSTSARANFTAPARESGATLTFRLIVTDDGGLKDSDDIIVRVRPAEEDDGGDDGGSGGEQPPAGHIPINGQSCSACH